jgi:hypothetical protein
MEESGAPQGQHETNNKTDQAQNSSALGNVPIRVGGDPPSPPEHRNPDGNSSQTPWWRQLKVWTFIGEIILIGVTVYIACIYSHQLDQMIESNKITRKAFQVSQGAYVTVGRKDGVVADFIVPKNPKQNAELVVYFQNSGHLPAKFAWGTTGLSFLAKGAKNKSTGITYVHPYTGLPIRTQNKKDGSILESGPQATVIGGDSILVSTLGTISQDDLSKLPEDVGMLIIGKYTYCDGLGTYSDRTFTLRYRGDAPSSTLSFDLAGDSSFPVPPLQKPTDTTEYLPPCETIPQNK